MVVTKMVATIGRAMYLLAYGVAEANTPQPGETMMPRLQGFAIAASALMLSSVSLWAQSSTPAPAPRIATGAWIESMKEHPRLFGSKSFLRDQAKAKADLYQRIKSDNSLLTKCVVEAVDGLPKDKVADLVAAVMKNVAKGVTNIHQTTWLALNDAAITFDAFHDSFTPEERKKVMEWMNGHLGKYTEDEGAFFNSTMGKTMAYLNIAYATAGENPRAGDFRKYAIDGLYRGKIVPVLKTFGAGGGFPEGGWYTRFALWNLVLGLETVRRLDRYDGFAECPGFFYQRLAYEMYEAYPGLGEYGCEHYPVEGDGANVYGGAGDEGPHHARMVLAQYFRGSDLAKIAANHVRRSSNPPSAMIDFLYEEPADEKADLGTLGLAHLAAGIGRVYARSDWTDSASWLRFECGDFFANHQHLEVGNFEIFRYESLATESGEYSDWGSSHAVNYLIRTIAHNCILVYQPNEQWRNLRDGNKNAYANDGGQTDKWSGFSTDSVAAWMAHRDRFTRGKIVAYQDSPKYFFVAGDCTQAYSPSKLSLWTRQIVFIRPSTFVILDRVSSTKSQYAKTWLLHCKNEPKIERQTTKVADGKGEMTVVTLLPENAGIRKVKGYTYGGKTFDPAESNLTAAANKWRIEVTPPAAQTDDTFLHVIFTDKALDAKLIHDDRRSGVQIGEASVIFGGGIGGTLTIGAEKFPLTEEVKKGKWE
jgi:hypothetical protein